MTEDAFTDLLGTYALGAVTSEERDVIDAHLLECAQCRAEVAQHLEVMSVFTAEESEPPPELWQRISATINEPPAPMPAVPLKPTQRWPFRAMTAAAAIAAVLALVFGVRAFSNDSSPKLVLTREVRAALANPDAKKVDLLRLDRATAARVAFMPDGSGYFVPQNLSSVAADRTYELWAVRGTTRIPLGAVGNAPHITTFHIDGPVDAFAVTVERTGGVLTSRRSPVAVGLVA